MRTRYGYGFAPSFDGLSLVDDALRTFDRVLRNPASARGIPSAWTGAPEFSVSTTEDGWRLRAEVPGLTPENLAIEARGQHLVIRAKRDLQVPDGYRPVHRERSALAFERTFDFGRGFDIDNISAKLENGVLNVSVPKRAEEKPRAIAVKTA